MSAATPLRAHDPEAPARGRGRRRPARPEPRPTGSPRRGMRVTVYERDAELGGLAGTTPLDGIPIDRFYHVTLPTDERVIELAGELGLERPLPLPPQRRGLLPPGPPRLDVHAQASCSAFPGLSPVDRHAARGVRRPLPGRDRTTTGSRRPRSRTGSSGICGRRTWEVLWRPLLDSKFDGRYDDLPATYLWSRSRRMSRLARQVLAGDDGRARRRLPDARGRARRGDRASSAGASSGTPR